MRRGLILFCGVTLLALPAGANARGQDDCEQSKDPDLSIQTRTAQINSNTLTSKNMAIDFYNRGVA